MPSRPITELRSEFPILRSRAFLFSGAMTPAASRVRAVWDRWGDGWAYDPLWGYDHYLDPLNELKAELGALLGADPSTIAITDNVSRSSNIAIRLLAGRPGTNVVVDETTYPSSLYPWMTLTDFELRNAAATEDADGTAPLAAEADDETVAIAITHVSDLTGRRHDLRAVAAVAHDHGALLVVDAAQTAGVHDIDVVRDGVDVLMGTTMKWLFGPPGIGFLYIDPDLLEAAPLLDVGYEGVRVPWSEWPPVESPQPLPGARRLELGLPSLPALAAAAEGVRLVQEFGIEAIHSRVEELMGRCVDGLQARGVAMRTPATPASRGGVMAFLHPNAVALAAHARRRGVDMGGMDWGLVRVDPHAFNNADDIERFFEAYDTFDAEGDAR